MEYREYHDLVKGLIDSMGLGSVLGVIATICQENADSSLRYSVAHDEWTKSALLMDKASARFQVTL